MSSDFVHATPTLQNSTAPAAETKTSVTTNFQPTANKPLSGGKAAIAVILVFVFAGAMFYDRYHQQIDAFFHPPKGPVVKAKPPAKPSKLDQAEGRPTVEPQLPSATKYRQDVATYRVRSKDQLSYL